MATGAKRVSLDEGLVQWVKLGGGATMCIVSPQDDPALEWVLRYGDVEAVRYSAAAVVASYDYLVGEPISMKEATRRLRIARKAYRDASALQPPVPKDIRIGR